MIAINYPDRDKLILAFRSIPLFAKRKRLFEKYKRDNIGNFKTIFNRIGFEKLLVSSFGKNLDLIKKIESNISGIGISVKDITEVKEVFQYDGEMQQKHLSKFFEEHLPPATCYFCNIDFVNVFASKYADVYDFLNNAPDKDLKVVDGIGQSTADKIIVARPISDISSLSFLNNTQRTKVLTFDFHVVAPQNSFTLDHVIDKGTYPYLALNLFNLVPSCYTCNSKLKGSKEIGDVSPTDKNFDFHDIVKFKMFFDTTNGNINDLSAASLISSFDKSKLLLRLKEIGGNKYDKYIEVFRLNARYNYHMYHVVEMLNKREKYPDTRIKEIAILSSQSPEKVKRDLFSEYLYDDDFYKRPLAKLTRDIAEDIGLIP